MGNCRVLVTNTSYGLKVSATAYFATSLLLNLDNHYPQFNCCCHYARYKKDTAPFIFGGHPVAG